MAGSIFDDYQAPNFSKNISPRDMYIHRSPGDMLNEFKHRLQGYAREEVNVWEDHESGSLRIMFHTSRVGSTVDIRELMNHGVESMEYIIKNLVHQRDDMLMEAGRRAIRGEDHYSPHKTDPPVQPVQKSSTKEPGALYREELQGKISSWLNI